MLSKIFSLYRSLRYLEYEFSKYPNPVNTLPNAPLQDEPSPQHFLKSEMTFVCSFPQLPRYGDYFTQMNVRPFLQTQRKKRSGLPKVRPSYILTARLSTIAQPLIPPLTISKLNKVRKPSSTDNQTNNSNQSHGKC